MTTSEQDITPENSYDKLELSLIEYEKALLEYEEKSEGILIDMSDHAGITGEVLRVELRRTRDPATGRITPERKLVDDSFIIGLISPEALPEEGKAFKMPYHNLNEITDFGDIDSKEPITKVVNIDKCFFFSTSEGSWRLKILDVGN